MLSALTSLCTSPTARARKAALNQLKNRLGSRTRKYPFEMVPGGTLSRLLWIMDQHPRSFSGFLWLLQWMSRHTGRKLGSYEEWGRAVSPWKPPTETWNHSSGHPAHDIVMASEAMRVDRRLNDGKVSHFWELPHPHLRLRIDRYLPWLAAHFDAMLDEPTQEAFQQRWIPSELIGREGLVVREKAGNRQWWQGVAGGGVLRSSWPGYLTTVMDWVEAEGIDFMCMTPAQALLHATEWHRKLAGGQHFRSPVPGGVHVAQWPDGAHIDRLVTKDQLRWEGTSMGHCVGGMPGPDGIAPGGGHYWQGVRDGRFAIFSYRDEHDIPWVTAHYEIPKDGSFSAGDHVQTMGPEDIDLDEWDVGRPGDGFPLGAFSDMEWINDYEKRWGEIPDLAVVKERFEAFLVEAGLDPVRAPPCWARMDLLTATGGELLYAPEIIRSRLPRATERDDHRDD